VNGKEKGEWRLGVGRVLSVNVGGVREFEYNGRPAKSAIASSEPRPKRIAVNFRLARIECTAVIRPA
jgi:hypothetical protein